MKLFEFLTKYSDLELRSQKWAKARSIGPKKPRDQGLSADSTQFFFPPGQSRNKSRLYKRLNRVEPRIWDMLYEVYKIFIFKK